MPGQKQLELAIEAILFVSSEPVTIKQLAAATNQSAKDINQALKHLSQTLQNRGINLLITGEKYSLVSSPSVGKTVDQFLGAGARTELSKPALETLSIIAYKQPVSRSDIEAIRGVSCEQTIRNLLLRGLITEDPSRGRQVKARHYITSPKFLQYFGFTHPDQIPPLDQLAETNLTSIN